MTIETCYNYVVFLNRECDRYLKNHAIDDDEIHQLKIELERFQQQVNDSDLPWEIKTNVTDLKIDYHFNDNREYFALLGSWDFGKHRRLRKLKKMVEVFKSQIDELQTFIRSNY